MLHSTNNYLGVHLIQLEAAKVHHGWPCLEHDVAAHLIVRLAVDDWVFGHRRCLMEKRNWIRHVVRFTKSTSRSTTEWH